jgi:hypothetical protein
MMKAMADAVYTRVLRPYEEARSWSKQMRNDASLYSL